MQPNQLSEDYSAVGQIWADELDLINELGFKSIICNRPEGESVDQQSYYDIEQAAINLGIACEYIPVAPSGPTQDDYRAFKTAFANLPKPILAYCKTGGRSTVMYQILQQDSD